MKHMNENERILAILGTIMVVAALVLSLTTEVLARKRLAEYKGYIAAGAPNTLDPNKPSWAHHIGYLQQTLDSRWSVPDGHGALGVGFAAFGVLLVSVPRATARKRHANS